MMLIAFYLRCAIRIMAMLGVFLSHAMSGGLGPQVRRFVLLGY